MADQKMTLIDLLRAPAREADGSLSPRVETDMQRGATAIEALRVSLNEMIEVYWADGDGEMPEPACIQNARAALAMLQ